MKDTIAAVATAMTASGIGIIRISDQKAEILQGKYTVQKAEKRK